MKPNKTSRVSISAGAYSIDYECNTMSFNKLRKLALRDISWMLQNKNPLLDDNDFDDGDSDDEADIEALRNKNLDHRKLKSKNKKVKPDLMYS